MTVVTLSSSLASSLPRCHAVTLELGQDEGGPNICAPDRSEPDIPMSDKGTAFVHLRDQVGSGRSFWFA